MPIILAPWGANIRRIEVQDQPRKTVHETFISKITRAKWIGGMGEAVECLFFKCKALSSIKTNKQKQTNKKNKGKREPRQKVHEISS
jgi:hypothetical protein